MNDQEAIPPAVLKVAQALIAAGGLNICGTPNRPEAPRRKPYRVAEVADELDVHRATVYRDVEAGRCGAYRIGQGSGAIRISVEDFEDYKAHIKAKAVTRHGDAVTSGDGPVLRHGHG